MTLRIGLVTDIHCGPDMDTRLGSTALDLLGGFAREMSGRFKPDLIVDLGDRINDVEADIDRERIRKVQGCLETVGVPVLFLYGNHDLINVNGAAQLSLLNKSSEFESLNLKGFHLVCLNSQDPTFGGVGGTLSPNQLDWLEKDLKESKGPVLVFCHHPLDEQDFSSHWYFNGNPQYALAVNRERARSILTSSRRVRAAFHGHMHWNHVSVLDDVPYVTVCSLTCCGLTGGPPAGSYAEILVEETGRIQVKVRGAIPMGLVHQPG